MEDLHQEEFGAGAFLCVDPHSVSCCLILFAMLTKLIPCFKETRCASKLVNENLEVWIITVWHHLDW